VIPLGSEDFQLDAILRRAVHALGHYEGAPFAPAGSRAAAFLRGEGKASRVSLTHPEFPGDPNSWLAIAIDSHEPHPLATVSVGIHVGRPGQQLALEWSVGLEIMPRLAATLSPILAYMNGRLVDLETRILPRVDTPPPEGIPEQFTPWTFINGDRLNADDRRRLEHLPAAVSEPITPGWVVQAVNALDDSPHLEFLERLSELESTYIGPALHLPRGRVT
jgi:hypothetical protein